ncbi:MAG: Zn-dependent hydrolase, partial [Gammaproteobacteria bacterium]|nr:Zn-dependent hydrolase [Gammaproteobacteria bacterium]
MTATLLTINSERLRDDIDKLGQIGRRDNRGLYRMAFSDGDMQGRQWLKTQIENAGLYFCEDGAANLHARHNWDENKPSVVTGSHLDTIPGAGHLDGALGVLAGLEALRRLKEEKLPLNLPLELIAFTDEEGRFGGMFGSQAICGQLTPEKIYNAVDLDGNSIVDAMGHCGYDAMAALMARRSPESIHAFVEMHIEQGPVLDAEKISIGIVEGIAGLFKWNVTLKGNSNHAGSTPMDMRQDAFQGLAEVAGQIDRV